MRVTPASRTLPDGGHRFDLGGEEVRVIFPGPGHSPDNLVVWFPARRLLFGGCLIKGARAIGFTGHADLDRWPAAIDRLRPLGPRVVVPGHGPVGGPELFELTAAVVRDAALARARLP
jgi:glyoxylase-like metal-dependent hydrolase (beta-lactamase superfamily II)